MQFVTGIPEGAVRIHFGRIETAFCPRGSLEKESLSLSLLERLRDSLEHWTDPKYGDSYSKEEAVRLLLDGFKDEVSIAVKEFVKQLV